MKPARLVLLSTWLLSTVGLTQTPLRQDLFAQPKLLAPSLKKISPDTTEEGAASATNRVPRLTSVLNAGSASIAVLDGVVLRLNESSDGYRLIQVGDRSALLSYKGQQVRVHMSGAVEAGPPAKPTKEKP